MKNELLDTVRLSNQSIRIMVSMLREAAIDPAPVFRRAGVDLSVADAPQADVSGTDELRFQQAFVGATRDIPGLWMRTGLRYRIMSYGPLGLAVLAAANVAEGLRVLDGFQALTFSLMRYQFEYEDGLPVALVAYDDDAPAELREFLHERSLGSVTTFLNDMCQPAFPLVRIESALSRPRDWQQCERLLGVPVMFGAEMTRWVFAPNAGAAPLPMASPLLEETYQSLCSRLIGAAGAGDAFLGRLYQVMVRSGRGFPSARAAAALLSMSERTLHRRLADRGMGFSAVLAKVRNQRATELLEKSTLSVEQIADMLGFAETASFSRAFKRWTGFSPLNYRRGRAVASSP
ncbi:AraC family transcriptional regulator [Chelatococcus reniformis]|uniref:AraC family transcriptional regulator n=2 Tax=Chelatococcus reniformis TaxID=1494448 RepID=A0A916TYL9_9HYPH|nr:AraC family transcriptional regulator [Chelatococcus reniformis]